MSAEYSNNSPSVEMDIDAVISANKNTIRQALNNSNGSVDSSMLQGTLNFCHSKLSAYILDTVAYQYQISSQIDAETNTEELLALEKVATNIRSVGNVIDKVWLDIHHPAIKLYQNLFLQLSKTKEGSSNSYNNNNNNNRRQVGNSKSKHYNSNGNNTNGNNTNGGQNYVEYRKLFDRFVKLISKALDFYFSLLKTILTKYDLSIFIPVKKIYSTLKIDMNSDEDEKDSRLELPKSNYLVSCVVYLIHKCVLFIGDLSRYRTLVAKTYLPLTSISKEDNNNYSKSIELYKLSLLILPSLGDPYNHIAIIDNVKDDKFNVVYNFVRASLTSTPLALAQSNLLNLLNKNPKTNTILKKFEYFNSLDRQTITKNDRLSLLKSQFLILFNYNLLPSKWKSKPGILVSGQPIDPIENDFYYLLSTLDFHKQIFNDFYFKQLVILVGGFELLIDQSNMENSRLKQSTEVISDYLAFMFRFLENLLKICINICHDPEKNSSACNAEQSESTQKFSMAFSTSLLPVIRLLLCWFKEREIARVYMTQSTSVSYLLAVLINRLVSYLEDESTIEALKELVLTSEQLDINNLLNNKPVRSRLFKEDVALREFKPINYILDDFDDTHFYKKEADAVLALIGELPYVDNAKTEAKVLTSSKIKVNDNIFRLMAIVVLGKKMILENTNDIKWVDGDRTNDRKERIGSFIVEQPVDLVIKPSVAKRESVTTLIKTKDSKPKKKSNNDSTINTNSSTSSTNGPSASDSKSSSRSVNLGQSNSYAGSSFSNFGISTPESLGKLDRSKKNKSSDLITSTRPKTHSNSETLERLVAKRDGKRPTTSPNNAINTSRETLQQQEHSQYVDMVANIVNEDKNIEIKPTESSSLNEYDHLFKWNVTTNDGGNHTSELERGSSGSRKDSSLLNQFGMGNIGTSGYNPMQDRSERESVFDLNNMNNINNMNMDINRMVSNASNDFNSFNMNNINNMNNVNNMNINNMLGNNPYYNNMNNLNMNMNMNINNYTQPPLNSLNSMNGMGGMNSMNGIGSMNGMNSMGSMSGMNGMNSMNLNRLQMNNHNINNNISMTNSSNMQSSGSNSSIPPTPTMQGNNNYMNGFDGYNNSFGNINTSSNGYDSSSQRQLSSYRTNSSGSHKEST